MNSERDQLQALIIDLDGVLRKMSSRMAWWMSGDTRSILERVRNYLVSLEETITGKPNPSKPSAAGGKMTVSGVDNSELAASAETQAKVAWQALVGEMNTLRDQVMQPMVSDLAQLQTQRESLIKEIRELELRKQHDYSLAQQQANQQKVISEFLHILMGRLQESLSQSVSQFLGHVESQAFSYESSDRLGRGGIRGESQSSMADRRSAQSRPNHPLLDPQERLEHLRMLQAQSDELLISLDSNLRVIFDAVQRNVHSYQDSLLQELEKMQRLGQQNDLIFSRLVYHLAQELGQDSSTYLESSLKLTEVDRKPKPSEKQPPSQSPVSLTPSPSIQPNLREISQKAFQPNQNEDPQQSLGKPDTESAAIASESAPQPPESSSWGLENDTNKTLLNTEIAPPISSEPPASATTTSDEDSDDNIFAQLEASELKADSQTEAPDIGDPPSQPPEVSNFQQSEAPEELRSLDSLTDLIDEMDLGDLSPQETVSTDPLASRSESIDEQSYIPASPEESLLATEEQPTEETDSEFSIDTNILQQLSEDLLNLEAIQYYGDEDDTDSTEAIAPGTENWGWGEELPDESESDAKVQPKQPDIPATISKPATPTPNPVPDNQPETETTEDDDIFGNLIGEAPSSPEIPTPNFVTNTQPKTETTEDDDIFGNLIGEAPSSPEMPTPNLVTDKQPETETTEDDDIFGNLIGEAPSSPEMPTPNLVTDNQPETETTEDDDIFGNLIGEAPSSPEMPTPNPQKSEFTSNTHPTKTQAAVSRSPSRSPQTASAPPVAVLNSKLDNLTLEEIFADLVAASPPPANTSDEDDWVEIDDVDPSPSPFTEEQPDAAKSSVDDFFGGFDDSSLSSEDETSTYSDADDLSDLESWLSEPISDFDLEPEDSSDSNLDDFFAKLSDRSSIPAVPSDEDLFG